MRVEVAPGQKHVALGLLVLSHLLLYIGISISCLVTLFVSYSVYICVGAEIELLTSTVNPSVLLSPLQHFCNTEPI